MPDMYRQASMKAQEWDPHSPNGVGMKVPPAGTVPVNYEPYTIALLDTLAAKASAPAKAAPAKASAPAAKASAPAKK